MSIRRKTVEDANSPGRLAAEFGRARSEFEARRANIIQRGTTRMNEIAALQVTLAAEQTEIASVVSEAEAAAV